MRLQQLLFLLLVVLAALPALGRAPRKAAAEEEGEAGKKRRGGRGPMYRGGKGAKGNGNAPPRGAAVGKDKAGKPGGATRESHAAQKALKSAKSSAGDGDAGTFRVGMALGGPAGDATANQQTRLVRLPVLKIARGGGSFSLPPGKRAKAGEAAAASPASPAGPAAAAGRPARHAVRRAKEDGMGTSGTRGGSAAGNGRPSKVERRQIDAFGFERQLGTADPLFANGKRGKMQQGKLANGKTKPRYGSLVGRVVLVSSLDAHGILLHADDACQQRRRQGTASPSSSSASACYFVLVDIRDRPQMTAYVEEDDIVILSRDPRVQVLHPDISRYFDRVVSGMYMRKPGKLELKL